MSDPEAPSAWDLSDLYAGVDDPAIAQNSLRQLERAKQFEERYRGKIDSPECTAALLREALDEYESIGRERARPMAYASLLFAADTSDPARGAFLQKLQVESTAISRHLIFFDLEVGRMAEAVYASLRDDPALAEYRHYLEHERAAARHHLSEPEEKVVEELANTGVRAFVRLFSEINSRATFQVELKGEKHEMNQSQVLALLYDADRDARRAASEAMTATFKGNAHVVTYIYNNLLQEKATTDRLRGYTYPEQARHENNELEPEVVQNVVEVTTENFGVVADYYRLKRQLLGLDELTHYDRYAPLSASGTQIGYAEAKNVVLDAFGRFSPQVRDLTEPFFTRGWIDAEVRNGKRGGAFCAYITPDLHPYVHMNYTGRARDVMTLAHELGHALHGCLASRNNYLSFIPSLPMAETASVFGEMLVFESLQSRLTDPRERLVLLCNKIEDTFATVFRQVSMFRFEQAAHQARRAEGELTTERYNALWQSTMQEMFEDSLKLEDDHAWWWLYIPHIFATPFYVYAYAFGELLVLALYARYRQEGEPFVARYLELLATGGSRKPTEVLGELGIDIREKAFWQGGIDLIGEMVEQAKALAAQGA